MFDFELISFWPWALVAACVAGLAAALIERLAQKESAGGVVGGAVEALLYAGLGCLGGLFSALFFSYLLPAEFFALVAFALAGLCLTGIVLGLIHGTAGAGSKVLGVIVYLAFAAVCVAAGILVWGAARGDGYVAWLAVFLAVTGATMGILFAIYRSAHWAYGWLLVFLNGSWGALGTLTGFLLHLGSWTFYTGDTSTPTPGPRQVLATSKRRFFHCWQNGMRILPNYFFSQGPVMTAWTPHGMWHEAVHVVQHYIFGPLMPISYFAWAIVMGLVGAIVGLFSGNGVVHGAFAWGYVNNPWEVWEYNSSWGSSSTTPRKVSQDVVKTGKTASDLVFPNGLAWTLTVIYLLIWVGLFALLVGFGVT